MQSGTSLYGNNVSLWLTFGGGTKLIITGPTVKPSVSLLPPSSLQLSEGSASLLCLLSAYSPQGALVSWTVDGSVVKDGVVTSAEEQKKDGYTRSSTLTLSKALWEQGEEFVCKKPWVDKTIRIALRSCAAAYIAGLASGDMDSYKAPSYNVRKAVKEQDKGADSGLQQERNYQIPVINESPLERVDNFRYLSVHIIQDLSWSFHINTVVKKARQRLYHLRHLRDFRLPSKMLRNFHSCTIESILTGNIATSFGNSTMQDRRALQRVVRSAECIIRIKLPDLHSIYNKKALPLPEGQHRETQEKLLPADLEKAYDRVPREELWYCMRKSGVAEKYVRVVQDMYERSRTVVRCSVGQTEEFNVEVGLHQGSALSPFLFAIVMDQLSEEVRQESPWTMMFADDIVICSESREQVEENLERWRFALQRRGMKVSGSKTEYMCVNEREGSGTVRLQGEEVKKVQEFKYLGSTVQSNGECGKEVKKRVQAGWNGWRKVSGVLCDQKISARIKGKVYRTVVRPAMLYGLETVSLRKRQESEQEVAELKMLRFSLGVTRLDRIRNEYIRGTAHVGRLGDKVREDRLRWFGHVQRRERKGRELAEMMERRKVDILCVQETRWKASKACSIGAGFKLFYYGVDSKRNGVGVVLKEEFVRNVLEVKRVSDRVMSLKLEIEGVMLNVVSGYAPQVGCELEEKERFWSELDEVMESIPTGERVVIGMDFNGHVGEGNRGDEEVMGKFGVKERNLEGQMVVDFAKRMDMAVVNTYFQKREEHRVTYKSGGRRTQKLRQALGGQVVLLDDWETTAEVIRETGRKVLGVSSGRRKEDKETWWWNEVVQDSIQRKRLAKKKWDMDRTEENRQEYKELQRRVKREVSKAKQKAYDELYNRLNTRLGEKDLYRLARQRDQDGKDVQQVRVIKDRDGRVLTSEESVQRRWKEYFEELMNEENEREKRVEGVNSVEQKVDKIRKDEVRKAVGPDDILVEVWKCLGEAVVEFLTSLFNRVLENLEKAYDRVPREELWYCMRKSGVAEKYIRVVQDMYERSRTVVRCAVVMDQLSEEVRQESPWTMMFVDDIVICSESREQVEENLERWRFALERRGMKVSHIQSDGECGKEVKKRVQAAGPTVKPSVSLLPPSSLQLSEGSASLLCLLSAYSPQGALVSWTVDGSVVKDGVVTSAEEQKKDGYTRSSTLTLSKALWEQGEEFVCKVSHGDVDHPVTFRKSQCDV
ncbi:hypothetical protein QTP86_005620 [Hemibagrus guttatus]|nr:hypothetical protein QTP86_005620 [Hemibagrus guttatus]